LLPFGCLGGQI